MRRVRKMVENAFVWGIVVAMFVVFCVVALFCRRTWRQMCELEEEEEFERLED